MRRVSIVRAFIVSVLGTGFSRVLGAVRDIAIGHVYGAGAASDAFWVAYTIPNMFRRFVADEGLTGVLIPGVAKAEKESEGEGRRLAGAVLFTVLVASVVICALGIAAAPWVVRAFAYGFTANPEQFQLTVTLTRWLLPFLVFVALVSYCEGLLNHRGHFFVPKLAPGLVCACLAASALYLSGQFEEPILALVVGVLVGGVVHLLVCLPPLIRLWGIPRLRVLGLSDSRYRAFLGEMGKVVAIGIFAQINIVVLRQLAAVLEAGSVTQYWYANRVVDLAQGAIAVGVGSALLPAISQDVAEQDWERFREDFARAVRLAALVLIPAGAVLLALATPMISVLFLHGEFDETDALRTAMTLRMMVPFMLAVAGINIVKKVYFAVDDRNTLLVVGGVGVLVTGGVGYALLDRLGVEGLGLALSLSTCVQLVIYLVLLRRKLGTKIGLGQLVAPLATLCVAAVPAAAAGWWLCTKGAWERGPGDLLNIAILTGALGAAGVVYLLLCKVLRVQELEELLRRLRARLKR